MKVCAIVGGVTEARGFSVRLITPGNDHLPSVLPLSYQNINIFPDFFLLLFSVEPNSFCLYIALQVALH